MSKLFLAYMFKKFILVLALFFVLVAVYGCFSTSNPNADFECDANNPCENGFVCENSFCVTDDSGSNNQEKVLIRGITFGLGKRDVTPELLEFIKTDLKNEGVNVIQWRVGYYHYQFRSYPEVSETSNTNPALERSDVKQIIAACKEAGIYCFPGVSSLSHQGTGTDSQHRVGLLRAYPEFDISPPSATKPGRPTHNDRSWNPYHPDLHPIIFDLYDELIEDFEAKDMMIGLDEVYMMPEVETDEYAGTPYYDGQPWSEVFAYEYGLLHEHLTSKGITMWAWGDELLNYRDWGRWNANGEEIWPFNEMKFETDDRKENNVYPAIDMIAKNNVIISDWHYSIDAATAEHFASKGFDVVSSPWHKSDVALSQLERHISPDDSIAPHMKGVMHTTWMSVTDFIEAYKYGEGIDIPRGYEDEVCSEGRCYKSFALGSAKAFKDMMSRIREMDPDGPPVYKSQ